MPIIPNTISNHLQNVDNKGKKVAEEEDNHNTEEHDCQSWIYIKWWCWWRRRRWRYIHHQLLPGCLEPGEVHMATRFHPQLPLWWDQICCSQWRWDIQWPGWPHGQQLCDSSRHSCKQWLWLKARPCSNFEIKQENCLVWAHMPTGKKHPHCKHLQTW